MNGESKDHIIVQSNTSFDDVEVLFYRFMFLVGLYYAH